MASCLDYFFLCVWSVSLSVCVSMGACICVQVYADACKSPKRVPEPLHLELKMFVSDLVWVLGTEF